MSVSSPHNQLRSHPKRRVHDLPVDDPWELLHGWRQRGRALVAWYAPEDALTFAGTLTQGIPVNHFGSGTPGSSRSRQPGLADAPIAILGGRFDPRRKKGQEWAGWPSKELIPIDQLALTNPSRKALIGVEPGLPVSRSPLSYSDGSFNSAENPHRAQWLETIDALVKDLRDEQNPLQKVVAARTIELTAPEGMVFDPLSTVENLRRDYPGCTSFLLSRRDGSAFVGATPERLIRRTPERIETVALAGTIRRGELNDDNAARSLLEARKDRHEHRLVVEAITRALHDAIPDLELEMDREPRVRTLANVLHLETRITAPHQQTASLGDLMEALHPTPAVGGVPRADALNWLRKHEPFDRGWYAAPLGWTDGAGNGAAHVALRCALIRGQRAWLYAGAGIVPDSDPAAEWDEINLKFRPVLEALACRPARGRHD